ncbi:MAG: phytoene desaturase family protein, partial [Acidimicrobiia bacterium]
ADLVSEWFESGLLKAVTASEGIFGTFLGPRSGGTGAVLLMRTAGKSTIGNGSGLFVRGGLGALTQSLARAASACGADVRTGAEVDAIDVQQGVVRGIHLTSGEMIPARTVVSNLDPKHTLLQLIDPAHLNPDFLTKIRNYRCHGATAKVNLALGGLPTFSALKSRGWPEEEGSISDVLSGRIHIGPDVDYLERAFDAAKYGDFSTEPYLDVTIPSISYSSLAPTGRHVMSICAQYAPYHLKTGDWATLRDKLGDAVVKTLASYAPDLTDLIIEREVITPLDLERIYGLTGGHIYHGEPSLDQLFTMRPILDWARYRTPIQGLYLCGSGTHPGIGLTGACGRNASREILKDLKESKVRGF